MPDPCEYIYESVGLGTEFNHGQSLTLDEYIATSNQTTTSTHTRMFESIACTDTFGRSLTLNTVVDESIDTAISHLFGFSVPVVAESINCADLFSFSRATFIDEVVNFADTYTGFTNAYVTVPEAVTLASVFGVGMTSNVTEAVAVNDAPTYTTTIVKLVTEAIDLGDAYPGSYISRAPQRMYESVSMANSHTSNATTGAAVFESISVAEMFWFRDQGQIGWQFNTETTALNWNTNFMFDSIAQYGNTVLAVAPDGVYILDGDTDDGVNIDSSLKTGFMDFDDHKIKRLGGVFFGLKGNSIKLAVEPYDPYMGLQTSEYVMPEYRLASPGSNRITPGKGLSSRYWRMTFKNVLGGDFDIDNIELDIASSTQRRL